MTELIVFVVLIGGSLLLWAGASLMKFRKDQAIDQPADVPGPSLFPPPRSTPVHSNPGTPAGADELPRVRAMLVGPSASGKTMQLAALHHQMSLGDSGVRLRPADERTFLALGTMVTRIMQPDNPEPPDSTDPSNVFRWNFDIEARGSDTALRPLFHLTYLDYAGEINPRIFEPPSGGDPAHRGVAMQQFRDAIADFDVLLGVLDGAKIAQAMSGTFQPGLEQEIWQALELLANGHQKVTHLVLTKWDEFSRRKIELGDVVAHLDGHAAFRNLRSMAVPGQLRLLPVSALGLDPYLIPGANGLVKSERGPWNPFNPGVPLACGITDIVTAELQKLDASGIKESARRLPVPLSPIFASVLAGLGLVVLGSHSAPVIPGLIAGKKIGMTLELPLGRIIETFRDAFRPDVKQQELRARRLLALPASRDPGKRAATANLLAYCAQRAHDMEQAFPASNLAAWPAAPIPPAR